MYCRHRASFSARNRGLNALALEVVPGSVSRSGGGSTSSKERSADRIEEQSSPGVGTEEAINVEDDPERGDGEMQIIDLVASALQHAKEIATESERERKAL
jgi:hypothetical protein